MSSRLLCLLVLCPIVGCAEPSATVALSIDPAAPKGAHPYALAVTVRTDSTDRLCAVLSCESGSFGSAKTISTTVSDGQNGTRTAVVTYESAAAGSDVIIANVYDSAACPPPSGTTADDLATSYLTIELPDAGSD